MLYSEPFSSALRLKGSPLRPRGLLALHGAGSALTVPRTCARRPSDVASHVPSPRLPGGRGGPAWPFGRISRRLVCFIFATSAVVALSPLANAATASGGESVSPIHVSRRHASLIEPSMEPAARGELGTSRLPYTPL